MKAGQLWHREQLLALAAEHGHVPLDLSLGVAADPEPAPAPASGRHREPARYPPSRGTPRLLTAAAGYLLRRFGVTVPTSSIAACAGAKEFIATAPLFLSRTRAATGRPRDTVLIPTLGYPPYEMGAGLAGLRSHRVPVDDGFRMRLDLLPPEVVDRALCLWVNSPANPTGVVEPLAAIAEWGRARGVVVLSDEAYADTTWLHEPRTVLSSGLDGVLAVHSLSKRSNAPGLRVGTYAGDPRLVDELTGLRRQAGLIAAETAQAGAALLLDDDRHAEEQRARNAARIEALVEECNANGLRCTAPEGGLFLWLAVPGGDAATFAREAAVHAGIVLAQGDAYGPAGRGHVRISAVHDRSVIASRLKLLSTRPSGRTRASMCIQ
ncbi:pyridoxal phosphate-dependent aminotransferase [Amycolatopsis nigrescens]|uniref:pyridoxal phosphate-dependent aminotransferase n=1 Tax=Amycolatopsis nigrescens TaxID=381445 RepID=UPI000377C466|nr:aminotransferase class I/II-fold pyridoxal phosphate-dependent enzyme [Amycolatopsis nigrescens]